MILNVLLKSFQHPIFKVPRASHRPLNNNWLSIQLSLKYIFTNVGDSVIVIIRVLGIRNSCQRPTIICLNVRFGLLYHHCHRPDQWRHQFRQNQSHGPRHQ